MIIEEYIDNVVRHYSDRGAKLRQKETGTLWNDAIDVLPCRFTYEETDIPLDPPEENDSILSAELNASYRAGVNSYE